MAKHADAGRGYCARCGELFPCTTWRLRRKRARDRQAAILPTAPREPRFVLPPAPPLRARVSEVAAVAPEAIARLRDALEPAEREAWRRAWED